MTADREAIRVELPAHPDFLRIARLNVTAYGAHLDLDVEQLDDLRLAVNEAVTWMIDDPTPSARMVIMIHREGAEIVVTGGPEAGDPDAASLPHQTSAVDELIAAILGHGR
ncbi:MAG: hypothetical protein R2710_00970 [Acidimicrobiales bacterium]